ncbi:glycosyltransferase family 4 protein [Planktomarina sp.]|nr:glycosyltransferase family 4 protein [Planktomarina sp.]MDB4841061.1 glycosyltransferase family 4 protein [Planktomarina sp.]
MHILFLSDNFPPEGNAPATRTYEHAREWIKMGHRVTIVTCAPNFPEGKVFAGYKNKWFNREVIDGIEIWRVKTFIAANAGFFKRTLDFISFMLSSFFFGLFSKKVDVVIGTSPQFFTVLSAWGLARLKRVPFIFELRDIWPASISAVGVSHNTKLLRLLEKIELFLYDQADAIISVTKSFSNELAFRGVHSEKIHIVLNGVDTQKYKLAVEKEKTLAAKYDLENKFVAGYIGTHGLAHGLDNLLDAASLLRNDDNLRIVFAGGGADRKRIEQIVDQRKLVNVVMIPAQPKEMMPALWSLCDVSIVNLKDVELFQKVIPSKIFEAMGMGIPIIISVPKGEATDIISTTNSGIVVPPENPIELANAIKLMSSTDVILDYKESCLLAAQQYDRRYLARSMIEIVEQVANDRKTNA